MNASAGKGEAMRGWHLDGDRVLLQIIFHLRPSDRTSAGGRVNLALKKDLPLIVVAANQIHLLARGVDDPDDHRRNENGEISDDHDWPRIPPRLLRCVCC